ncbi:MAG: hypothetical protein IIA09_12890, partial [Proteobacteria bacterium]|nr:hypothetical protein [Pseudomonadota bacterium]
MKDLHWRNLARILCLLAMPAVGLTLPWDKDMQDQPSMKPQDSLVAEINDSIPVGGRDVYPPPKNVIELVRARLDAGRTLVNPIAISPESLARGREMYDHLYPRHLWNPYSSHSNRAWHFLGEIGIAFLDEIPDAGEWAWFAANVFTNVYPVWSDDDGGWHEGSNYWRSYIGRFTWWADIMKAAMDINAFD